jgi:hypothetical protein
MKAANAATEGSTTFCRCIRSFYLLISKPQAYTCGYMLPLHSQLEQLVNR